MCQGNADGYTNTHTDHTGRQDQGQALSHRIPIALVQNKHKAKKNDRRAFPRALQKIGQRQKTYNNYEPIF